MAGNATGKKPFKWIGGHPALDFNNTVDWAGIPATEGEMLTDFRRLVEWGEEAELLSAAEHRILLSESKDHPKLADRGYRRAVALRERLHLIFYQSAQGNRLGGVHLRELNAMLSSMPAQVAPGAGAETFQWRPHPDRDKLARLLWSIAWSAAQLLTSPDLRLVKTCANERCGWLFLDRSRKHNRRWCEMGVCGNRAKVRRFHERQRESRREL